MNNIHWKSSVSFLRVDDCWISTCWILNIIIGWYTLLISPARETLFISCVKYFRVFFSIFLSLLFYTCVPGSLKNFLFIRIRYWCIKFLICMKHCWPAIYARRTEALPSSSSDDVSQLKIIFSCLNSFVSYLFLNWQPT